jgi:hypothetical protein
MRKFLIRVTQISAVVLVASGLSADISFAEKQSPKLVKQMCATGGGTFVMEWNGKYSCAYPKSGGIYTYKHCSAGGDCEYVWYCGKNECGRFPTAGNVKETKPKPSKPSKRDDLLTAGTAADRGLGQTNSGVTAGAPMYGGGSPSAATTTTGLSKSAQTAPKTDVIKPKPATPPAQLSERVNRLQQQR